MFVHNLNPTIFKIGPFEARWYGLVFLIGFLLVYYVINKKRKELRLTNKEVDDFILYIILGTIIGARLFLAVWDPVYYLSNPLRFFKIWEGGMSLHGGLLGVLIVGWLFSRKKKINFLKLADIVVLPALFALALGRIANFINGELVGTITNVKWCVDFGDNLCRHPVQLYGAVGRFALFAYLFTINKYKKFKEGFIFWNFIFWMGIGRFIIDFLREDPRVFGLSLGQYLSLILAIIGIFVLVKYYKKDLYRLFKNK